MFAACNCNGHSEECQFDPLVYEETNQTSGGVCMNCRNNRAGRQCDRCADFFYPIPEADNSFLCIGKLIYTLSCLMPCGG